MHDASFSKPVTAEWRVEPDPYHLMRAMTGAVEAMDADRSAAMRSGTAKFALGRQPIAEFIEQQNRSSSLQAKTLHAALPATARAAVVQKLVGRPVARFLQLYVTEGGWRHGLDGWLGGALSAWCEFLLWAKWWEASLPRGGQPIAGGSLTPQGMGPSAAPAMTRLPPSGRATLSAVVLTKNEEPRIARCLASVRWADEIIVVDGMSTDRTVEICRRFGARVVPHAFEGSFAQERNLGMDHAGGDWVLQIDADDVVTPAFRAVVERLLADTPSHAAFKFRRKSYLMGRFMRYGGWHHYLPNLVRRDAVRYEGVVHERPIVRGTIGQLEADVEHHPCDSLSEFLTRHNRYTTLAASELWRLQPMISQRQLRTLLIRRPWKTFWKSYVKKGGFREGLHGLVFAMFFAGVEFLKWAKYWEAGRTAAASTVGWVSDDRAAGGASA